MADDIQRARSAVEGWKLGQTSARFESSGQGAGVISAGKGDHGGVSYGTYQLSTRRGTLNEYLHQSSYGQQFTGLTPATPAFNAKWKELAKTDPGFAQDQHEFIGRSHYREQQDRLKGSGIDLSDRGRSVQDALWSTSVQFRGLTTRIFDKGLEEKFGKDYELSKLSDRDIVEAVQDYKIAHNSALFKSSPEWHSGLLRRANAEKADLVKLAMQEDILRKGGVDVELVAEPRGKEGSPQHPPSTTRSESPQAVLRMGEQSERARSLQIELNKLGYTDAHGRVLRIDGDFGESTRGAVRSFQKTHGLFVDGVVGSDTRAALLKAQLSPLISERTHPDNALFQQARDGVRHLPAGTLRTDAEIDNAAAVLASRAKQSGMTRIDHVMLNTRGDALIGLQGSPQDPGRQFVAVDKTQAASQGVERSTGELVEQAVQRQQAQVHAQVQHMEHRNGLSVAMKP